MVRGEVGHGDVTLDAHAGRGEARREGVGVHGRGANHSSGAVVRSPAPSVSTTSPGRARRGTCATRSARRGQVGDGLLGMRVEHGAQHEPTRHPGLGLLPRRVHVGEHERVGARERVGEVAPQRGGARVAVRLEHRDDALPPAFAGGADHGVDVARQVRVVVDVGDAVALAAELEPARHAGEAAERARDRVEGRTELERDRRRAGGVHRVVTPGHRELHHARAPRRDATSVNCVPPRPPS